MKKRGEEESTDRDGVLWNNDLHDPESEWPLLFETVRWIIGGEF